MNKEYFINKFEAIPEEEWCVGGFNSKKKCALWHCGGYNTKESNELIKLVPWIVLINDGSKEVEYKQATPKQRVLAALRDLND